MILDLIRTKRAVREFTGQPVPEEIIREILEAGRLAQSSQNHQPWHFIVIHDRASLRQLSTCGKYAGHLAGAAFAIALVIEPGYDFDMGQAAAYMQLAAWELGVGSVPASIYAEARAREILGFPPEWHLRIALSFGYPWDEEKLTAPPKKGGRKSLDEIVHWDRW